MQENEYGHNWQTAFCHFKDYCGGSCCFDDITVDYCQKFLGYLMSEKCARNGKLMMASSANNCLCKLKTVLRIAFDIGQYYYNAERPHAVSSVDNTDNLISTQACTTYFNELNKISSIQENGKVMTIDYGPDLERCLSILK